MTNIRDNNSSSQLIKKYLFGTWTGFIVAVLLLIIMTWIQIGINIENIQIYLIYKLAAFLLCLGWLVGAITDLLVQNDIFKLSNVKLPWVFHIFSILLSGLIVFNCFIENFFHISYMTIIIVLIYLLDQLSWYFIYRKAVSLLLYDIRDRHIDNKEKAAIMENFVKGNSINKKLNWRWWRFSIEGIVLLCAMGCFVLNKFDRLIPWLLILFILINEIWIIRERKKRGDAFKNVNHKIDRENILKHARIAAISQVMARNMSHNIGSHVMNNLRLISQNGC